MTRLKKFKGPKRKILKSMWIGMLVTIKVEKTISMIRNIVVPFIEAKDYGNENIHTFEIVNAD
jgi:hypothetical protein